MFVRRSFCGHNGRIGLAGVPMDPGVGVQETLYFGCTVINTVPSCLVLELDVSIHHIIIDDVINFIEKKAAHFGYFTWVISVKISDVVTASCSVSCISSLISFIGCCYVISYIYRILHTLR